MAMVYATLIIKGKKTIDDVPTVIRPQVIQILKDLDVDIPNKGRGDKYEGR